MPRSTHEPLDARSRRREEADAFAIDIHPPPHVGGYGSIPPLISLEPAGRQQAEAEKRNRWTEGSSFGSGAGQFRGASAQFESIDNRVSTVAVYSQPGSAML